MKFQISKSHNSFYYHFTALLNLLRTDDFATGGNGSDFIQLILWSEKKSSEASRPGFALASWPCQHHITYDIGVLICDTFDNNIEIDNDFTRHLEEGCWLCSNEFFLTRGFPYYCLQDLIQIGRLHSAAVMHLGLAIIILK